MIKPLPSSLGDSSLRTSCLHCGLTLQSPGNPEDRPPDGRDFCCSGCELIYRTIHDLGLEEFYSFRSINPRGRPAVPASDSYTYLDSEGFACSNLREAGDGILQVELFLEGVHCAGCVWLIDRLPELKSGVVRSELNFATGIARITFRPAQTPLSEIARLLDSLGYPSHPSSQKTIEAAEQRSNRRMLLRIGVAGFCAMNAMTVAVPLYQGVFTGIEEGFAHYFRLVSLLLTLPVITFCAWPFYERAFGALRRKALHIDLPIATAILAAFIMSMVNTFLHRPWVYFDSLSLVVFLLLSGRYLQTRAMQHARRETTRSLSILPATARVCGPGGATEEQISSVQPGMLIEVRAGERIPVDGIAVEGFSFIDGSILTGESTPRRIAPQERVNAGTLNIESTLRIEAAESQEGSRMARILRSVEQGLGGKPRILTLTDRAGKYFVAALLVLSVFTFVLWYPAGIMIALDNVIALLIVSCPCALGLATPAALAVSSGRASRIGILIRGSDTIERLSLVDRVFIDKTGTVTEGRPEICSVNLLDSSLDEAALCRYVAELTAVTPHHPAAFAASAWRVPLEHPEFVSRKHIPGRGIHGISRDGSHWNIGSPHWFQELGVEMTSEVLHFVQAEQDALHSILLCAKQKKVAAVLAMRDSSRAGASEAVRRIRESGRCVSLLSGDRPEITVQLGTSIGIPEDRCIGGLFPEDKMRIIERHSGTSAMIGDGINDTAAMSRASVAVGVRGGLQSMLEVVDVFLSGESVLLIAALFEGADRCMRVIRRNLIFSLIYNVSGAAAAMSGWINPLAAAVLMPLSSLTVISSALFSETFAVERGNTPAKTLP